MSHIKPKIVPASSSTMSNPTPPVFLPHKNTMSISSLESLWPVTGSRDGHVTLTSHSGTSCMMRSRERSPRVEFREPDSESMEGVQYIFLISKVPKAPLIPSPPSFLCCSKILKCPILGAWGLQPALKWLPTPSLSSYHHPPPLNLLQFTWPELRLPEKNTVLRNIFGKVLV